MNILNAVNLELPYGMAAGIRLVNTAWHLAEAGANVNLLAGISPSSDADEILEFYGLRSHPRLSVRLTRPWSIAPLNQSSSLRARAYFLELIRLIYSIKPGVLFGAGMPNHLWALRYLKKSIPFRVVLELHQEYVAKPRLRKCWRLTAGPIPSLDGIVTTSLAHRDLLIEEGVSPNRVHSVYAGYRPALIPYGERHVLLKKLKLPISPGDPIVLHGGHQSWNKGLEDLLLAFRHVVQQVPKAHLVVLGTGEPELEKHLRALVKGDELHSNVHFTGRVPPTAVGLYLAVADIGVVPNSSREMYDYSCPIKLSEYLGAGLAVVATNLLTIAEVVVSEKAALLVTPESPKEMADAIIHLLINDDLRHIMKERALEVGRNLTYQARANSIYQFFEQLIDGDES